MVMLTRREFLKSTAVTGAALSMGGMFCGCSSEKKQTYPAEGLSTIKPFSGGPENPPNIIIINADDLGYGDLGCYGSQAIHTPHIDNLAEKGTRFTDFHACDSVCTPSRAGLLTGRYPKRMRLDVPLQPEELSLKEKIMIKVGYIAGDLGLMDMATEGGATGLPMEEITIAEALKVRNYRTAMVGKWHLGDFTQNPKYNPVNNGFDSYFGVPYSNDMTPFPLYRNETELEANISDQSKLTRLYTEEALRFISAPEAQPFFLYFAHTFPHRPLYASDNFKNRSEGGLFGDTIEEIDWSVGQIIESLETTGRDKNTIIMFTSDNGPWYQGSPGQFRGRKGQSYEGGHRIPFIVKWDDHVAPGTTCDEPAMNIDLFPTCMALAGLGLPTDRIIDGKDIQALFSSADTKSPHDYLYFYHHGELEAIRSENWKYLRGINHYVWPMPVNKKRGNLSHHTTGPLPMLFNLEKDPGEAYDLMIKYPKIGNRLHQKMIEWEQQMASNTVGTI